MANTVKNYLEEYRKRNASNTLVIGFEQPRTGIIRYLWLDLTQENDPAWDLFVHCCRFSKTSLGQDRIAYRPTQDQAFLLGNLPTARTLCTAEDLKAAAKAWKVNLGEAFENLLANALGAKQVHGSQPWWDEPDLELGKFLIQAKLGYTNAATVMVLE